MGDSKGRGNHEQRTDQAKEEYASRGILEMANHPVDEEQVLFCSHIYHAAVSLKMPVQNPETRTFNLEGQRFAFADLPFNRGMLAVIRELREQDADEKTLFAVCFRIMHFDNVLRERTRFQRWSRQY